MVSGSILAPSFALEPAPAREPSLNFTPGPLYVLPACELLPRSAKASGVLAASHSFSISTVGLRTEPESISVLLSSRSSIP